MTERENLCAAVKKIAWGYVLLHLNVNLGSLNILPDWLGYGLMLAAIPAVGERVPSAKLLKPLGVLLAVWEGVCWIYAARGMPLSVPALELVATVVSLYFHFQLLTDLAELARLFECSEEGRIRNLRTVRTLLITMLALPFPWEEYTWVVLAIVAVHVVVAIWICSVLFSLCCSLETEEGEA